MPKEIALVATPTKAVEPLGVMFLAAKLKKDCSRDVDILMGNEITYTEGGLKDYEVIGFSVITGWHRQAYALAESCSANTRTIIGGAHATFFADQCAQFADIVIRGEAMNNICELINRDRIDKGIYGPIKLIEAEDYPFADRVSLYNRYPQFRDNPIKNVMASFGCPFACSYCYNDAYKTLYGEQYKTRVRPAEQFVAECHKVIADWKETNFLFFQDDCFGYNMDWLYRFTQLYRKKRIPFHAQMRLETVNQERLTLLKLAGCTGITVAIESGHQTIRKELLNRGQLSNIEIAYRCNMIKEAGLKLRTEQMVGLPTTTLQDDLATLRLNVKVKPDIAWSSIFAPYLGTHLGDLAKEKGLYDGDNDDLSPSFFADSCLKLTPEHRAGIKVLNKLFTVLAHIPEGYILAEELLKEDINLDTIFEKVRKHLYDNVMYDTLPGWIWK